MQTSESAQVAVLSQVVDMLKENSSQFAGRFDVLDRNISHLERSLVEKMQTNQEAVRNEFRGDLKELQVDLNARMRALEQQAEARAKEIERASEARVKELERAAEQRAKEEAREREEMAVEMGKVKQITVGVCAIATAAAIAIIGIGVKTVFVPHSNNQLNPASNSIKK